MTLAVTTHDLGTGIDTDQLFMHSRANRYTGWSMQHSSHNGYPVTARQGFLNCSATLMQMCLSGLLHRLDDQTRSVGSGSTNSLSAPMRNSRIRIFLQLLTTIRRELPIQTH